MALIAHPELTDAIQRIILEPDAYCESDDCGRPLFRELGDRWTICQTDDGGGGVETLVMCAACVDREYRAFAADVLGEGA